MKPKLMKTLNINQFQSSWSSDFICKYLKLELENQNWKNGQKFLTVDKIWSLLIKFDVREHIQKTFVTFSGFWPLRGWGGLAEFVKKGKFAMKIFFKIMLNKVLEICKNDICCYKKWFKTAWEKRTGSFILQLFTKVYTFSKFKIEREADMLFSFNLGWYSIQLDIAR